jgi:hypothetical protein
LERETFSEIDAVVVGIQASGFMIGKRRKLNEFQEKYAKDGMAYCDSTVVVPVYCSCGGTEGRSGKDLFFGDFFSGKNQF